jgi:hypothetical protein
MMPTHPQTRLAVSRSRLRQHLQQWKSQQTPEAHHTQQNWLDALRADQWAENHPEAPADQRAAIKRRTRDAFYVDTPAWQQQILDQGLQAVRQGVAGLSAAKP